MKKLIFITLLLGSVNFNTDWFEIFQADIFVDAVNGNDANSGTWFYPVRTIAEANSIATSGDRIGLYADQTWNEVVTVPANNITYKKVGRGDKPVISGFTTVTGFTKRSNTNVWVKKVSTSLTPVILIKNGVQMAKGRTPNSNRFAPTYASYYHIDSHTGTTVITDTECNSATTNWNGAELVFFTDNDMHWAKCPITNHSGTSLTITNSLAIEDGKGYFIQNDLRTLDQNGEWYHSGGTADTLYIYSSTDLNNDVIKISTSERLIDVNTRDYITVKNIAFEGANDNAIETDYASLAYNLTVYNCSFNHVNKGIYGHIAPLMTISNCSFTNCNYVAIYNHYWSEGAYIANNTIDSTGLVIGNANETEGSYLTGTALYSAYGRHKYTTQKTIIEKNTITNSGYNGIWFGADSAIVRNNYINKYNMNKSDGGAIYTGVNDSIYLGMKIQDNICLNGVTSTDSTGQPQYNVVTANYNIYLDNTTDGGTTVSGNTCANTDGAGLMVHMSKNVTVSNNTFYNCRIGVKLQELSGYTTPEITGLSMTGNKIISKHGAQKVISGRLLANNFSTFGTINNNYYAKPMDGNPRFVSMVNTFTETERDSASWRTYASQDANSVFSKIQLQDEDSIRFYTNPTAAAVTYALNDTLVDVAGTKYNTSVTVPAYSSVVLWNDDAATYTPKLLGVQTVGGSAFSSSIRQAMPVTMTENGTITAIVMYMGANTSTTARVKLGLYSDSAALPSSKLGETDAVEQLTFAGFLRVNLVTPVYVTSGTTVWFAWVFEHATQAYYTAGTPGRANTTGTTFSDGMPASFGSSSTASSKYSGYVIYK